MKIQTIYQNLENSKREGIKLAEQQYANYEDKLLNDTIRFENGNFVWGSNSEIIPENEIDDEP